MGLGLAVSLRRYVPSKFENISLTRCLIDVFLTMTGYTFFSNFGYTMGLERAMPIRKNLILQNDIMFLRHLHDTYVTYPKAYKSEKQMFLDVLKPTEFEEWVKEYQAQGHEDLSKHNKRR